MVINAPTVKMSYNQGFDPSQQGNQYEGNGNAGLGQPPQGMPQGPPPNQGMAQQQMPDGGSPAPFAQQGGVEGANAPGGEAKTTLW